MKMAASRQCDFDVQKSGLHHPRCLYHHKAANVRLVFYGHSHLWNNFCWPQPVRAFWNYNVVNSYGAAIGDNQRRGWLNISMLPATQWDLGRRCHCRRALRAGRRSLYCGRRAVLSWARNVAATALTRVGGSRFGCRALLRRAL